MRNITNYTAKLFLATVAILGFCYVQAQNPGAVSTDISGTYVDVALTQYGLFGQYRVQASSSAVSGARILEFPTSPSTFFPVWRAYTSGQTLSGYNQMIDPATATASARYNSSAGTNSSILLPVVTAGRYYTINVMTNRGLNDDTMAVLETSYNPVTITNVSIPVDTNTIGPGCSPSITATLSATTSAGEYVYLRYSTTGFSDASTVIPMVVSGTTATASIPAYPAGTHIDYYVMTSPNGSLISTGPGSGYYDCQTLNLKNGSVGNNFRYTVKSLPVSSVSVTPSQNPICSGVTDIFTAHPVNSGTLAPGYHWYKNGATVGTNSVTYSDATLNNGDSVWVVMQANLGCPVLDTSNHIVIIVNPLPTGSASVAPTTICFGDSSLAIATPINMVLTTDFQGIFDPSHWTFSTNNSDGTVSLADLPGDIDITSGDNGSDANGTTDYTITLADSGIITFDWFYTTNDTTQYDFPQYILNGVTHLFPGYDLNGSNTQSGSATISVKVGDVLTLEAFSIDNLFGPCDISVYNWVLSGKPHTKWYSASTGGSLLGSRDSLIVKPVAPGQDSVFAEFTSTQGCTNPVRVPVAITVKPWAAHTQNPFLCYGDSIKVGAVEHKTTGTFIDTLQGASALGCDSVVTTNLTVYPLDTVSNPVSKCFGQTYAINGHIYDTTGTYIDTFFHADRHGCDSIVFTKLIVHPLPVITLGPPVRTCGGSVVLDGGTPGSTYAWSDQTTNEIDTVSTSGVYYVTVTTIFGCIDSSSKTVYIRPIPSVNLGPDAAYCTAPIILDAGNVGDSYLWSDNSTSQTLSVSSTGIYSVIVTDTSSGCTGYDTVSLTINNTPTHIDLGNDTSLCGGTLTLNAGDPANTYIWSTGETTNSIVATISHTYSVTVTYPTTCTATGSISVNIFSQPNLGADIRDSICPFTKADLYSYYQGTGLALTFSTPTPAAVDTGVYTVIGTNTNGCSDTALVTIIYRQKPDLGADRTDSACPGYTYNLRNLYPNTGYASYTWTNVQHDTAVGPGTYQLIVSNASGCTDTAIATINVSQKPNLGGNKTDSVCYHYTYDLTTLYPNIGYATYVWNVADPTAVLAGTYQLVVSNATGCTDTAYATIIYRQQPIVTLPDYPNVCSTVPAFGLYGGSPNGGNYFVNNNLNSVFDPPTLGPGVQYVVYVYTNASGCTDSAIRYITVYPKPVIIDTVAVPLACSGTPVIDLNQYFSPTGGVFSGLGVSDHYFYPSITGTGTDSVTYIYTDQNGCMDTAGTDISVIQSVKVTLHTNTSNLTICQGDSITFFAGGAVNYQFFVNGQPVGPASTTSTFTSTTLQNHDQVSVVGSNACSSDTSDFVIMIVNALPVANAGTDTTINLGQSTQLHGSGTGTGSLVFDWSPSTHLNFPNVPDPTYNGPDTVLFTLKVTDANGCWDTATVTVNVFVPDNVLLPNLITPNDDGYNDAWVLNAKINLTGSHLVIFNRWGEKVYETDNYANNWKGTYMSSSDKLPDGTYYYVLKVPAQHDHVYEGPINILSQK